MRSPTYRLPHLSFAPARNRARRLVVGVISLALGAVCWALLASAEPKVLSLRELTGEGGVLMSCAEDAGPSSEPLWCADPDSPHCIPALPESPSTDAWHGPVAVLSQLASGLYACVGEWLAWPEPCVASLVSLKLQQRLERPPKQA